MASRLNQLFQIAPDSFLERTVLFSHELASFESRSLMANKLVHHVDIDPIGTRSRVRLFPAIHQYFQHADVPMLSYVIPMEGFALVPKHEPPQKLVFLPEFTCCRLLVQDDEGLLRFSLDHDLKSILPPPEDEPDSRFCDSINYWEFVTSDLVGVIRGTAILFKELEQPWRFVMQQIVGPPGAEVIRQVFSRDLRYPAVM
jgi:hypothetical protein